MCFITGMPVTLLLAPAQGVILPEIYVWPQAFNEKKLSFTMYAKTLKYIDIYSSASATCSSTKGQCDMTFKMLYYLG